MSKIAIKTYEKNVFPLTLNVKTIVDGITSVYNLTGATVTIYIKTKKSAGETPVATVVGTVTNALLGKVVFSIPLAATATVGAFIYNINVSDVSGLRTVSYGDWIVTDV